MAQRRFVKFEMDLNPLIKDLKALEETAEPRRILKTAFPPVAQIMADAQNKAPVDQGVLQASGNITTNVNKVQFRIGFGGAASEYAAFQDGYFKLIKGQKQIIIRPKKKRWIYVPLNRQAAKGWNEKLKFGGFFVQSTFIRSGAQIQRQDKADYILMKEVVVRIKEYGSTLGPNQYFSGTLERRRKWFPEELARLLEKEYRRVL